MINSDAIGHNKIKSGVYLGMYCIVSYNNKQGYGSQKYVGVGEYFFAIVTDKSIEWEYEGAVHGFAVNEELLSIISMLFMQNI